VQSIQEWKGGVAMTATNINIRTDSELKAKAQVILADLGLDMSTAINVFLGQVVYRQAIPFEISKPVIKRAKLGGWEGKISISTDFNEPMEEFKEYME
jgi:DNA-damage-inducible protein J